MVLNELLITEQDYERLSLLVYHAGQQGSALEEELGRATVIPQQNTPRDLVTMNSSVCFVDESGNEREVTLVYPADADVTKMKVSVLAPVGAALIGMRLGRKIEWPMPNGKSNRLQVVSVSYQPEAAGDLHL